MRLFARVPGFLVLAALALIGPATIPAATPASGTIGPTPGSSVNWTGGPYAGSTALPDECPPLSDPANVRCDHFYLTVNVPASHWDANHGGADIQITWASSADDYDLYVYDNAGNLVGQSASGGTTSERFLLQSANAAQSPYEVRVVPFLVATSPTYSGSATFISQPGGWPIPPRSTGGLAFSPPATVVDAQRTEGEPLNWIDPRNGAYWESGPWGISTQQSFIHRSTDGGNQFNIVSGAGLRPDPGPGGGDTDVVTDDQGNAYFSDLESLVNLDAAVSNDNGNNWRRNSLAVQTTGVDRQWFTVDNGLTSAASDNTVFLAFRQELGTYIYSTPGSTGPLDPVGGLVYQNSSADPVNPLSTEPRCGQIRFDPVRRNIYYPCSADDHVELTVGHVAPGQRTGIEYHNVQLPTSPGGGGVDDLFPVVAADRAGNVYMAWVDTNDNNVYYSYSIDGGETWSTPVQVSGGDSHSNVMPWIQGGRAGTVVVAWYGNPSNVDSDFMPSWYLNRQSATPYKWYGYVSLIRSATTAAPTFAQARFTDQPMNYGQICTGGIGCTLNNGDRTMADFFGFVLEPSDGAIRIVYNDTTSQHHGAHLFEVRQVAGPSALGGNVNRSVPTSPVSDPTGDARSPHYSATGPGPNLPQFDFTQLRLSQPTTGTLRVQMTLSNLGLLTPPVGKPNSLWLTRFQALSVGDEGEESYRIFYVGAESAAGGPLTFFAGSGDSAHDAVAGDGCLTTTAENCKVVQYRAEVAASGSVSGNVITIDVPLQGGFGANRPIFGSTLYNVTAFSGGRTSAPYDVYADLDATRSFDFQIVGGNPPPPPPPPGEGCKVTGGGTIPTGVATEGTFTINAQPGLKGKAQFRDGSAADFRSTRLTEISCGAGGHGTVKGTGINNGHAVDFTIEVVDHGESGTTDAFSISLSDGYTAGGTLTRGNVQVHQ
ncbi:MAG TPA: post-COAP-1 domain-containing protein [Gaiellaceae bacterium]|nr:post-COAP-1 domain-containing protein [Gaiellaceae bacterium]